MSQPGKRGGDVDSQRRIVRCRGAQQAEENTEGQACSQIERAAETQAGKERKWEKRSALPWQERGLDELQTH